MVSKELVQLQVPEEKKTGAAPFWQRERCYDEVFPEGWFKGASSAGLVREVICCCSASDGNTCP